MYELIEAKNMFHSNQFGFPKLHSTCHAFIDITEDIRSAIDRDGNKFALGVFIDLQKVLETVDHNVLLYKLNHYGIRGVANDSLLSYLNNHKGHPLRTSVENRDFRLHFWSVWV